MKKAIIAAVIVLAGYVGISAALAHTAQKIAKAQTARIEAVINQL